MDQISIMGYIPGAIGRITELHGTYYAQNWDFGLEFEAKVATELAEFLSRYDPSRDGFWTVCVNDKVEGGITIDSIRAASEGVHLRWFILSDRLRGNTYGNRLMEKAVGFCRAKGYKRIYLWTFQGLDAARHLYEKFEFMLTEQKEGTRWGRLVNEQLYALEI